MSTLYYGSLDVTKLLQKLKERHSAFVKGSNGNIYCNIHVWRNDVPDKYDNLLSLMLNSKKEQKDQEGKVYIGNCKESEYEGPKPVTNADIDEINTQLQNDGFDEDIPF